MNRVSLTAFFSIAAIVIIGITSGVERTSTKKVEEELIRPFPIVAISSQASKAEKEMAKEIATALGSNFMESKTNPVCCIWVEVSGWTPNPSDPGYYIINQGGGSIVSASNTEQLKSAVARFKKSIRKNKNELQVPLGMMTNYKVTVEQAAESTK